MFEVEPGGGPFDAEDLGVTGGVEDGVGEVFQGAEGFLGRAEVVAHEEGALVADFAVGEEAGEAQGAFRVGGGGELLDAGEDVGEAVSAGHAVKTIRPWRSR